MQVQARFVVLCSMFPDAPFRGDDDSLATAMRDAEVLNHGHCPGKHTVAVQVWYQGAWELAEVAA